MAKTANLKKHKPAVHSRAARRATSPSIDVDKSLTSIKAPPESADHRPSVLALHHGAGVMKKTKRGRAVSSKARKRQEKGLERAELVMDRMEKKVEKSVERARSVKARRAAWNELNERILPQAEQAKTEETARRPSAVVDMTEHTIIVDSEPAEVMNESSKPRAPLYPAGIALPDEDEIL